MRPNRIWLRLVLINTCRNRTTAQTSKVGHRKFVNGNAVSDRYRRDFWMIPNAHTLVMDLLKLASNLSHQSHRSMANCRDLEGVSVKR